MTTLLDDRHERISRRAPDSFFGTGGVSGGFKGYVAGPGRFWHGCAVSAGFYGKPAAKKCRGTKARPLPAPCAAGPAVGVILGEGGRWAKPVPKTPGVKKTGVKCIVRDGAPARLQGRGGKKHRASDPVGRGAGGIPSGSSCKDGISGPAPRTAGEPGPRRRAAKEVGRPPSMVVVS